MEGDSVDSSTIDGDGDDDDDDEVDLRSAGGVAPDWEPFGPESPLLQTRKIPE